jgi:hypothetical protein
MRRSRPALRTLVAVAFAASFSAAAACIAPLDDEFTRNDTPPPVTSGDDAAVAAGCLAFGTTPALGAVAGDLHSVETPDGGSLWIASQISAQDGAVTLAPELGVPSGSGPDCDWSVQVGGTAFDPSPGDAGGLVAALDLVEVPAGLFAYYALYTSDPTMAFGIRLLGYGIAPQDPATGRFAPSSELLWSADRPNYGASAFFANGWVYLHGCKSNAPLTDDCYVARADAASVASSAGYTYWSGSSWSSNPDDAASIAAAGGSVSVRPGASGPGRYLMTYVEPFGTSLVARSAVAPEGPWSAPVELARCELDPLIPGAFCGGAEQHPELVVASASVVLSYDARTFATDAGADARAFWPRIVSLGVPSTLP